MDQEIIDVFAEYQNSESTVKKLTDGISYIHVMKTHLLIF